MWTAVVLACGVVIAGCVWGVTSASLARQTRNWLYHVQTAGSVLLVAGVVGQRHFPSDEAVHRIGEEAARGAGPGIWEAGVTFPGLGFALTPLAVVGLVVLAAGAALLLFFEGAQRPGVPHDVLNSFGADDAS